MTRICDHPDCNSTASNTVKYEQHKTTLYGLIPYKTTHKKYICDDHLDTIKHGDFTDAN